MHGKRRLALGLLAALVVGTVARGGEAVFRDGMAAYERGDYAAALAAWQPLAEQGSAEAQFNLGLIYGQGHGVEVDASRAADWYRRAAEQGFARAQYNLAALYEAGRGVEQDLVQAFAWFKLAGEQRYADARKRRHRVADRMSPYDIAQAELQVREWKRKRADRN